MCVCTQSCPTVCDPVDCSPPGSSVHGILQARIPLWVAISFSRGSSGPWDQTQVSYVSCIGRWIVYQDTTWEAQSGRNATEKEIGLNLPTCCVNHQLRTMVEKQTPRNSQPFLCQAEWVPAAQRALRKNTGGAGCWPCKCKAEVDRSLRVCGPSIDLVHVCLFQQRTQAQTYGWPP